MKKKILSLCLVVLMLILAIPISISAANNSVSKSIDLISLDQSTIGNGYEWDNRKSVLTLDNLNLSTADDFGINLPAGSTIILNGSNSIKTSKYGIYCLGALTIKGSGSLTIDAPQIGISGVSTKEKHQIVLRSGSITIKGASTGIYAEKSELVFSGANIKINAAESSISGKNIKIVSGNFDLSGKIKASGSLNISNTNINISSTDKAIDAARGVNFIDVSLSAGENLSSLSSVGEYKGEKAIKTVSTKKATKNGFLFGGKLPAFVDYIVISLTVIAVAAVIVIPIVIKRKKTAALIAKSEAQKLKKKK